jgi:hypothetical protein
VEAATQAPEMEQQEQQEEPQESAPRERNAYRIFKQVDGDDVWQSIGVIDAVGVAPARRAAVKEFNLSDEVRNGSLRLAVVANRFWRPVSSRVTTSEKIDFE